MTEITFDGEPIHTVGSLPAIGAPAPAFRLTSGEMYEYTLKEFAGKKKILNIVPSLETNVCAASARRFNEEAARLDNTIVLNISADLPFFQERFCSSQGLSNIRTLSTFRAPEFGIDYGVEIATGAWTGLMSRAVIIIDETDTIIYTEQVPDIGQEPDYDAAISAVR